MFEWIFKNIKEREEGFTLVELVVVIAILAILATITVPKVNKSRKNATTTAHNANVKILMSAANMYIADGEPDDKMEWSKDKNEEIWKDYLQEWPKPPKGTEKKDINENEYKVTINPNGEITVIPDKIDMEK